MIIDVPDDTGSAPILHTASCISIWTIEEDVGEVCLTLADEKVVHHGQRVFEGMLETNGRRIAFNESGVRRILQLTVANTLTKISLFANHRR
jgi:hypothetical protein